MKEKKQYMLKKDFTEEDGNKASELEAEFADMNGWEAESDAAQLLNGLWVLQIFIISLCQNLMVVRRLRFFLLRL